MSAPATDVFLGIGLTEHAVRVESSLGQRSSITSERLRAPQEWVELATYGVPLPEDHRLLACAAMPSGAPRSLRDEVSGAARTAGWDGLLLVSAPLAAGRALRAQVWDGEDPLALVVVDADVSSVGLVEGGPMRLLEDDPVHTIAGREAREVAVSLRCLLKQRARAQVDALLRRVVVVGESSQVERVGRRLFERELEALGVRQVEFELEPFLLARGALLLAQETAQQTWRQLRRRWK